MSLSQRALISGIVWADAGFAIAAGKITANKHVNRSRNGFISRIAAKKCCLSGFGWRGRRRQPRVFGRRGKEFHWFGEALNCVPPDRMAALSTQKCVEASRHE